MDRTNSESESVTDTPPSSVTDRCLSDNVAFVQETAITSPVSDPPVSILCGNTTNDDHQFMVAAMLFGILCLQFLKSHEDTTATPITPKSEPDRESKEMPAPTSSGAQNSANAPLTVTPQSTTFPDRFAKGSSSDDDIGRSSIPSFNAPATKTLFHPAPLHAKSSAAKLVHPGPPKGHTSRDGNGSSTAIPGNSRTWTSTEARVQRGWFKLEPHLSRMFPVDKPKHTRCPYVPRNLQEYTAHLSEMETLKVNRNRRILDHKEDMEALKCRLEAKHQTQSQFDIRNYEIPLPEAREAFDGKSKTWGGDQRTDKETNACNRSAVLGWQTIWCDRPEVAWRESADWPTMSEMKWEGVQRVATENGKFKRFPALPRVPHAPEVPWQTVPLTEWYYLDNPWPVPTEEDILAPTEDIADEKIPDLLNSDILEALDIGYSL